MKLPLELLYNLRLLKKNIGFVAICVVMIGLGMGLSITMYSISQNIDTRPFPFAGGERFVDIFGVNTVLGAERGLISDGFIYQTLETSVTGFEVLGAFSELRAVLSDGDYSEGFQAVNVKPELFAATGVQPLLGRGLQPGDASLGADPVAVISYDAWQSYYTGREDIIGSISRINGRQHSVVGVMPEGFSYPQVHDVWLPMQLPAGIQPEDYRAIWIQGVLAAGNTPELAAVEVATVLQGLDPSVQEVYEDLEWRVRMCCRFINTAGEPVRAAFLLPLLTLSLLLLICLNVANLILVRTNQRVHEFTIRTALGASRRRLILSVLQDSLLICLLGALLGFILADLGLNYVNAAATDALDMLGGMPYSFYFGWEASTAIVAIGLILLIWMLSASLAIWQISRQDLSATLAAGKGGATESRSAFGTATMVSIEVVFSCFLLVLTGVFIGASIQSAAADYGTATEGYLTGRLELPQESYAEVEAQNVYRQNLERELLSRNGVEAVSFTTALPSQGVRRQFYRLEDRDLLVDEEYPRKDVIFVADNYFATMEVPLLAGRNFDATDTGDSLPVVIIDQLFAEELWPNEPSPEQFALGQRIDLNPSMEPSQWQTATIVGVIPHVLQGVAMDEINRTSFYRPLTQRCCDSNSQYAILRVAMKVAGDPQAFRQVLQESAAQVDREVPVLELFSMTQWLEAANSVMVFASGTSSGMAFLTLMLAVTGIFAIVSRSVRQRTKEIGIRRAIGSSDFEVLWVFIRQGLRYLILGFVLGGGAAVLLSNAISNESVRLVEWLPLVAVSVTVALSLLVFVATYTPARALIQMEPGETLRDE